MAGRAVTLRPDIAGHMSSVLIVDDERHNRQVLEVMLGPEGFLLRSAASGEEALAAVAQQPPDLILLDIMMPGMDGNQVAARIKGDPGTRNIPIIMITALEDRDSRMLGLGAGAEDFLTKPVDRAELCVRVRNLLRLKTCGDYFDKYSQMLEGEVVSRTADLAERTKQAAVLAEQTAAVELMRQDQLRFKDEFLSHVSHELRSPLTAIKQFTSILLAGVAGDLNKAQREYQEIVLKNIRQLQAMIDDLLEVTRLENGKLAIEQERVSVSEAVADTVKTFKETARAKGITLSSSLPPDLPPALADQTRLRQILIILLDNAIKFTADAGAVSIQARLLQQDPRFLLLEVSDAGCGIKPEIAERIFERLYQVSETQASRKGLGLGLYICQQLVTRQGGRIWVKSSPNGSTFSFTLPVFSVHPPVASAITSIKSHIVSEALCHE
jgi:signal transduction histidine kinase